MSYGRGPPNTEGMTSLKVDNIPYRTSVDTLKRAFEKFGEVGDVYIPRDVHKHESRGFAFIRYFNKRDAEDAIDGMDGEVLDGRELRVQLAKYGRPSRDSRRPPPRRYGGGGGYGGGGRYGGGGGRYGRSRSRSPTRRRRSQRSYSRSRSRSRSGSPWQKPSKRYSRSRSASQSPVRQPSRSPSRSRSRSKS